MNEEFSLWVEALVNEGYDLSDYTWDEMYEYYENLIYEGVLGSGKKPRRSREERMANAESREQTDRKRAAQRRREKAEAERKARLAKLAAQELAKLGHTGKVSEKPMGSEAPESKEAAPSREDVTTPIEDERKYRAALKALKAAQQEKKAEQQRENYEMLLDYLLDEGYVNDYESANQLVEHMSDDWLENIFESEKWIQAAIKKPRALRKSLGAKSGKNISVKSLRAASHKGGKMGKRAILEMTLRKFH